MEETKQLSDATDFEEFKNLRHAPKEAPAEPAGEKATQVEETTAVSAAEPATAEPTTQETQEPAEKSVEDQIKELRSKGKHAQANKLLADEAARPHREEAEKLRKELEALKSRPSEPAPNRAEPKPAAAAPAQTQADDPNDPAPKITDEKYKGPDGFTLFTRDDALWAFRQDQKKQQQEQAARAHSQKVQSILQAGRASKPDFDAVSARVVINKAVMAEGVEKLDNLADVLYKIGSDPAEVARIQALSPIDQWAELRFASRELSKAPAAAPPAAPEPLKPAVSRVAPPPRVLSGTSEPPPKKLSDAKDYEEFKRQRKQLRAS